MLYRMSAVVVDFNCEVKGSLFVSITSQYAEMDHPGYVGR